MKLTFSTHQKRSPEPNLDKRSEPYFFTDKVFREKKTEVAPSFVMINDHQDIFFTVIPFTEKKKNIQYTALNIKKNSSPLDIFPLRFLT